MWRKWVEIVLFIVLVLGGWLSDVDALDSELIFAVVIEKPIQKEKVQAKILSGGKVQDGILLATETTLRNPMWKSLEMCQGVKAQTVFTAEGYRILEFRILGGSMLPMPLQGVTGDCFLKKAMDYAPLVE